MNPTFLGHQTTVDFYGCDAQLIDSCNFVEQTLVACAKLINLTVVNTTIHEFSPIGVSGVVVIEESHIAIHTWPEHNYVAVDFFTCNESYDLTKGINWLKSQFKAKKIESTFIKRGDMTLVNSYKKELDTKMLNN